MGLTSSVGVSVAESVDYGELEVQQIFIYLFLFFKGNCALLKINILRFIKKKSAQVVQDDWGGWKVVVKQADE